MRLQFGTTAFERARGDLPELPVINLFAEEAPTEASGIALQSRPGLDNNYTTGSAPVDALFIADGVVADTTYGISGNQLYSGSDLLGTIDGTGPYSMAGYENLLFIAGGASLWGWDGTTLEAIPFPDDAAIAKVVIAGSRAVCVRKDTGKFYWSDVLSSTIDALSFATAENQPDRLLDALFIDDVLILFGSETVEFWPNTGDADLPFTPLEGRVFEKGVRATGCATIFDATFAWVGNDNVVYLNGQSPQPISNAGMQAKIEASSSCKLFVFSLEGVEFLALRLDGNTYVMGARSRLWSEFASYGQANWIPQCYHAGRFGSSIDGRVLRWSDGHADFGAVHERRFRAGTAINSGGVTINNLQVRSNPGRTPFLTGDYLNPVIEMRLSRDAGTTWGPWRGKSLGTQGDYRTRVRWSALGMASQPGLLAEFRVTDPVPFRASDVLVNEPLGGR